MKLNSKQFFYVLLGSVVVMLGAGGAGYYYALNDIKATSGELSQQLADQEASDTTLEKLSALQIQYNRDVKPILPLIDEALPRTKNQTEILAQLQTLASDAGLNLSSVTLPSAAGLPTNTSQTIQTGVVLALPVSFQLQGSFSQLQTFLTHVENLSRFTNVTMLTITRADKTKPITYSMTLNAYIKP